MPDVWTQALELLQGLDKDVQNARAELARLQLLRIEESHAVATLDATIAKRTTERDALAAEIAELQREKRALVEESAALMDEKAKLRALIDQTDTALVEAERVTSEAMRQRRALA